jgi:lysophospholipase L1-like esterase
LITKKTSMESAMSTSTVSLNEKTQPRRRTLRPRTASILTSVLMYILCLLAAEGLLRVWGRQWAQLPVGDSQLGMSRQAPHTEAPAPFAEHPLGFIPLRTNNLSFYSDRDIAIEKPANIQRVVIVGDSQTQGLSTNQESYPQVLESLLNSDSPQRYEVINAGSFKYSPYQYYVGALHYVVPLKPDHLIVAIYLGNDLQDLMRHDDRPYLTLEQDGRVVHHDPAFVRYQDPKTVDAWYNQSKLLGLAEAAIGPTLLWEAKRAAIMYQNLPGEDGSLGNVAQYALELWRTSRISHGFGTQELNQYLWFQHFPQTLRSSLLINRRILELFRDLSREHGFRLTVLLIPTKTQVEPEDLSDMFPSLGNVDRKITQTDMSRFTNDIAQSLIAQGKELGVEVVYPLAEVQRKKQGQRLYYKLDMHLNAAGNTALAESLHDLLNPSTNGGDSTSLTHNRRPQSEDGRLQ